MGLTSVAVGVGLLASLVRGGSFARLGQADLRHTWMILLGFGFQALVDWASRRELMDDGLGLAVLLASFVLILGWLFANRHLRGSVLVFIGFALNAIVIAANGAMPVDIEAIRAAGVTQEIVPLGKHEVLTDQTLLPWLADRFPIVAIRSSISIGDIVLSAGMIPLVHDLMTSTDPASRREALRAQAVGTG